MFWGLIIACQAVAQNSPPAVRGVVTDENGEALIGVTVRAVNTTNGQEAVTASDEEGRFTFPVLPEGGPYDFRFSYLGFGSKTLPDYHVEKGKTISLAVKLQEDISQLEEMVVVGYGRQKRINLTGSISTMDLATKEGQPLTNVSNALYGIPGLFVNLYNSKPGTDRATIRIRGVGTLNNNDPLVLVNGIEYSMDELNPDDIETVTVLKDASAAIYGSRAANGVILITTKSATGQSNVNYNFYAGIQQPTMLPDAIWDPIAYMELKNQAVLNSGKSQPEYDPADIEEYQNGMATDPYTYPGNDWFDIALENGFIQKHNLSFSGGAEKIRYRLALGYLDRNGIIIGPNNEEEKYSLGLNSSADISDRLTVGLTFDGYYRHYNQPGYSDGSFWGYLMRTLPIMPDVLESGEYGYPWIRTEGRNNWEHPRMIAEQGNYKKIVQRFLSTVYADYHLPFNLDYHIKFGLDKYDGFQERFVPQMYKIQNKTGERYNWNNPATAPRSYNWDDNDLNIHFYNTLSWQKEFASQHNVSAMLGYGYDKFHRKRFDAQVTGYLDGALPALDAGTERLSINGHTEEDVLMSYFGRLNYDFKDKYLLEATFRYDGSSRFASGRRWGFFPGVSAGWRMDLEPFFNSNTVDLLKIRASAGQMGNQAVALYSYENSIALGQNYNFGGQLASGAASTSYTDPSITWETTTTYNGGVDLELLRNRLSFTADVYKRRTTDILRTVNLPAQVGNLSGPKRNVGTVDNTGYELSLSYQNTLQDFSYRVAGNFNYNKNRVVDLDGEILYGDGTNLATITQEGTIMNAYYILDAIGIFQTQEEVEAHADQGSNTRPGYIKYRDVNGDNLINGDDRIVINSSSIMPKYTYGFNISLGYKGFDLSADFQGIGGIKIYPTANIAFPFNNGANATWEWATDAWTPENQDARLPIVTESTGKVGNFRDSDFWLRDGSYLRLKSIQLQYALPSGWLKNVRISRAGIFVNAQNILTFSKYKDFDPEAIVNAASLYHYPMLKTMNAGVNVTF